MSVLYRVAKVLPSPLANIGKKLYINANRLLERNYYDYKYNGRDLRLYYTEQTFLSIRHLIQNETVTIENIPIDILEASEPIDATNDVGAHFGLYSVLLHVLNPDTDLYAFEPDDENRRVAEELLSENNIISEIYDKVITSETGPVTVYIDAQEGSESHATNPRPERKFQAV
jgi:hypothetical protein